jgi:ABC-2 type transport system permease protein
MVLAVLSFFLAIGIGIFVLPKASPQSVMIFWDAVLGVLLFSWSISLLIEVQRMELLSLEKLLHLPMTLRAAFLLNYLSSLASLQMVCFLPLALGLCIAMSLTFGWKLLLMFPLVFSFVLMLTAVTYQFRGWLASLMSNKRRQRTVMMMFTFGFIAISQLPNVVLQLSIPNAGKSEKQFAQDQTAESQALANSLSRKEITKQAYDQQLRDLTIKFKQRKLEAKQASEAVVENYSTLANQILPVGWLPYANKALLAGSIWPAGLCWLGMTLIGSASLWRAYSSTIRYYTGDIKTAAVAKAALPEKEFKRQHAVDVKPAFMEWKIPRLSERTSALTLCSLRNLARAPEAKMLFIGPLILGVMFVLMVVTNRTPKIPFGLEPLAWLAGIGILTFMCLMLMLNVFGMDRGGFRCLILMPAARSEILFAKNLSMLPIVGSLAIVFALGLLYVAPIGPLSLLACGSQMLISLLVSSIAGNWVSIQFPIAMIPGAGKPAQVNLVTMLVQMVVMMACPLYLIPGVLLFGIDWAIGHFFPFSMSQFSLYCQSLNLC